jgi:hypothetical protein
MQQCSIDELPNVNPRDFPQRLGLSSRDTSGDLVRIKSGRSKKKNSIQDTKKEEQKQTNENSCQCSDIEYRR